MTLMVLSQHGRLRGFRVMVLILVSSIQHPVSSSQSTVSAGLALRLFIPLAGP